MSEDTFMVTLVCKNCGEEFQCHRAWVKRGRRKFCSWDCKIEHQKTLTGPKSARYGIKHTKEAKEKMSQAPHAKGKDNAQWKGGKYHDSHGYRYVHVGSLKKKTRQLAEPMAMKSGYVLEHRLIMAIELDRPLERAEKVHHINGQKDDNRADNLMIYDNEAHSREHRAMVRRIGELEKEVERLKSLLAIYQETG